MEKMLTVDDVVAILQVTRKTAYTYMAQMIHLDRPRRVTESALRAWVADRTISPKARKKPERWVWDGTMKIERRKEVIA